MRGCDSETNRDAPTHTYIHARSPSPPPSFLHSQCLDSTRQWEKDMVASTLKCLVHSTFSNTSQLTLAAAAFSTTLSLAPRYACVHACARVCLAPALRHTHTTHNKQHTTHSLSFLFSSCAGLSSIHVYHSTAASCARSTAVSLSTAGHKQSSARTHERSRPPCATQGHDRGSTGSGGATNRLIPQHNKQTAPCWKSAKRATTLQTHFVGRGAGHTTPHHTTVVLHSTK